MALQAADDRVRIVRGEIAHLEIELAVARHDVDCGPGSIEQAHKPNEFLALDQLRLCEAFLDRLIKRIRR